MSVKGSCLCGAVTYEVTAPFQFIGNCHCSRCRKANGAAFVTWGILNPGTFNWTSGEDLLQSYDRLPATLGASARGVDPHWQVRIPG